MAYEYGNNPEKIKKYQAFWEREEVDRPLVGFTFRGWFPLDEYQVTRSWQKPEKCRILLSEFAEILQDITEKAWERLPCIRVAILMPCIVSGLRVQYLDYRKMLPVCIPLNFLRRYCSR